MADDRERDQERREGPGGSQQGGYDQQKQAPGRNLEDREQRGGRRSDRIDRKGGQGTESDDVE